MRVLQLWRYPVKSLQGERLDSGEVGPHGLVGDREYAIFDVATGFGLTARRHPEMLFGSARYRADGSVEITRPDGSVAADDDALSAWLGRGVHLRRRDQVTRERRYENPSDTETEAPGSWNPFEGAGGSFHDSARARVTVLSLTGAGGWPVRRFRPNVVVDGADEETLIGKRVRIGSAELDVTTAVARCVMVTRPQPGGVELDRDVLRRIHREHGGTLSVGATVATPGAVRVGDELV
jgi:uncharacterized protein YcbX